MSLSLPGASRGPQHRDDLSPARKGLRAPIKAVLAVVAVLLVVLVAVEINNALMTNPPIQQTPPTYAATLNATADATFMEYEGQTPATGRFLVVNASVSDTGNVPLTVSPEAWSVADPNGTPVATADALFDDSLTLRPQESRAVSLVFNVTSSDAPAKLAMGLPTGAETTASLPSLVYAATLRVDSFYETPDYQNYTYPNVTVLVVNVTVHNTGNEALAPHYDDWLLEDAFGNFETFADLDYYPAIVLEPGASLDLTLVFPLYSYDAPAKIVFGLPSPVNVVAYL